MWPLKDWSQLTQFPEDLGMHEEAWAPFLFASESILGSAEWVLGPSGYIGVCIGSAAFGYGAWLGWGWRTGWGSCVAAEAT